VQQVAQAVNGQEALAAVEARGGGDAFDVLLIDLHMPLMGGLEVSIVTFCFLALMLVYATG
jgi:CheY-like chemotaxis protein